MGPAHRSSGCHQKAPPALPVQTICQKGLQRAATPQAHEARERKSFCFSLCDLLPGLFMFVINPPQWYFLILLRFFSSSGNRAVGCFHRWDLAGSVSGFVSSSAPPPSVTHTHALYKVRFLPSVTWWCRSWAPTSASWWRWRGCRRTGCSSSFIRCSGASRWKKRDFSRNDGYFVGARGFLCVWSWSCFLSCSISTLQGSSTGCVNFDLSNYRL